MKVLVIGGGAAGMMAAVSSADHGADVIVSEKNEKTGKKLYITGKGRCNITNNCSVEDFFDNVTTNPKFLYSAVYSFTQEDVCSFFESEGLKLKEERGKRVFPASDRSSDVIRTFDKALKKRNVTVLLNTCIREIIVEDGLFREAVTDAGKRIAADAVIIATGGLSYSSTGSTGDGYRFAAGSGHRVEECVPSLVPLKVREDIIRELEGLSLKNVGVTIGTYSGFGEMLFTSDGVSGPLILSASSVLAGKLAKAGIEMKLSIDLKPALDPEKLDQRILRDFSDEKNRIFKNSLKGLLPAKLIPVIVGLSGIREDKKVNEITKEERKQLVRLMKNFELTVTGTKGFEQAVITKGGVNVRDIDPSTMRSKKVSNIYFAGEVIDTDAMTGGFNLQIAWSTGYLAGMSAAIKE